MKVQITKNGERFLVHSAYNPKVIRLIRKVSNRYYNKNTKTWYLPIKDYDKFKDSLAKISDIEYEIKEIKPIVFIKTNGDKIEVKFNKFIEQFNEYLEFKGRCYDSSERKLIIPKEHFDAVVLLSKELGFQVVTDDIIID